jgi:hypothetical protein
MPSINSSDTARRTANAVSSLPHNTAVTSGSAANLTPVR